MLKLFCLCLLVMLLHTVPPLGVSQSRRDPRKQNQRATPKPTPEPSPESTPEQDPAEPAEVDTVKINTDLVVVPVVVTDRNGLYVGDLQKSEFDLEEDGVKQEIAFFATVSAPFHVVLMLDTSASTQEKLSSIQQAAYAFTEQLQKNDRVKVISFDQEVRDLNEFTSDREVLREAINRTRPGQSTKLYDAIELALASVRNIQGRKAIVLFSDGVDFHSDRASFDGTLRNLDEEGVIVYPIRYDTRAETEEIARRQAGEMTPQLPTIDVIRRPPPGGTTAPTFPGEEPDTVPTGGTQPKTGPFGLPLPAEIMRRRREAERERNERYPSPDGLPPTGRPTERPSPGPTSPSGREEIPSADRRYPSRRRSSREDDSIGRMLDNLYLTADSYLKALAEKSGGRILPADTLKSLPDAFAKIAAELRTQYALGYYPLNRARDDRYRRIKVKALRKDVATRTRPGYHLPAND